MSHTVRPHPLNNGFTWPERPTTGLRRLSADQVTAFNRDGAVLASDAVPAKTLAALTAHIDPLEAAADPTELIVAGETVSAYDKDEMSFTLNMAAKPGPVRDFCLSSLFRDLTRDLMGPGARLYWDQAVYKKPGKARTFPWHQDNGYTFARPQDYLTCWVPLVDATVDNGCPWIMPGLHRMGTLAHETGDGGLAITGLPDDDAEAVPMPAAAGDIVIFSSLTPHKTGPNVSDGVRKALIVQFIHDGAEAIGFDGVARPATDPTTNPRVG